MGTMFPPDWDLASAEVRIGATATALDGAEPTWFNAIDTSELDLADVAGCIIGQLENIQFYWEWQERATAFTLHIRPDLEQYSLTRGRAPVAAGFDVAYDETYAELTAIWLDEINQRRETQ